MINKSHKFQNTCLKVKHLGYTCKNLVEVALQSLLVYSNTHKQSLIWHNFGTISITLLHNLEAFLHSFECQ